MAFSPSYSQSSALEAQPNLVPMDIRRLLAEDQFFVHEGVSFLRESRVFEECQDQHLALLEHLIRPDVCRAADADLGGQRPFTEQFSRSREDPTVWIDNFVQRGPHREEADNYQCDKENEQDDDFWVPLLAQVLEPTVSRNVCRDKLQNVEHRAIMNFLS
eukprot:GEMP01060935.1.p1 GENE.GEMP01060935.1~~GEMP01060935.1.p1  ORF type:complete len:160 (+),score=35.40 GEMP01060935.1:132-611(+)